MATWALPCNWRAYLADLPMYSATFYNDIDRGPDGGKAWWATTSDNLRIRIGGWGAGADKGTILLFPGRTEYIEKYGPHANFFLNEGFATLSIDWRGQGLADRLLEDHQKGHVHSFKDYQKDVSALLEAAEELGFKPPYFLLAHSMGGCIGYRALHEGLPVKAVIFTGPMWGIEMSSILKHLAPAISGFYKAVGLGNSYIPSGKADNYVQAQPFEGNALTTDPDMYEFMKRQVDDHPELGLGGPTNHWLSEALADIDDIMASEAPDVPCLCYVGSAEKIVDPVKIHNRMSNWPGAELIEVSLAEHEVLMEGPEIFAKVMTDICQFFTKHSA